MTSKQRYLHFFASVSILLLLFTTSLLAQNLVTGDVAGTVTDPSGAVVPNAKVELKSSETGFDKTVTTGSSGDFRFSLLRPGTYAMTITSQAFSSVTRTINVSLGQVANASTALSVGSSSTTVEVSGEAPLLQTENANLTTTFDTQVVQGLPNPGGDITYYANVAPGVTANTSGGGYGNFSAYGLPATSNLFTENGNDENDPFLNLNNSGSSNLLLGKNEVQEVAVVTNGYTGQYGRQAGASVNYTTKSGTNFWHGDATYDWNGRVMNANEWFNKQAGNPRPFANSNQWAADFGGPIKKDKTFFYVDTEGIRYVLPSTQNVYFPTPGFIAATQANIAAVSPAQSGYYNQILSLYQNSPAYSHLLPYSSSPNYSSDVNGAGQSLGGCGDLAVAGFGAGGAPCLGYYRANGRNLNKEWLLTARVDQNIGTKDVIFGRFKTDHGSQPTSTDIVNPSIFSTQSIQPSYEGQLNWTHTVSPNSVNNLIASGLWYSALFTPNSGQAAVLGALGVSTISFGANPMSALGGTSTPDYYFPQGRNVTQYQIIDDYSWTKGRHELKFGVNYRRNDLSVFDQQSTSGGFYNFESMADFFSGVVNVANGDYFYQSFPQKNEVPVAIYSLGLYAQDTFKVTPNLTLTMALRADRVSNPVCQSNCFADLTTPFTSLAHDATVPYNQIINSTNHSAWPGVTTIAWQPRFGFSYNPAFAHNTVLRGGIGLFSDLYPAVALDNMIENAPNDPTFVTYGTAGSPAYVAPTAPASAAALAASSNAAFLTGFANGSNLAAIQAANPFFSVPNFFSPAATIKTPMYLEWNFQIEQQFGNNNVMSVNYVGNHGYNLLVSNTGQNIAGAGTAITSIPSTSIDPRFAQVTRLYSGAISNYDGLITSFTHRFGQGLQFQVNYTWSHALDEASSSPFTPFNYNSSISSQISPNCLRCLNYGNSDFDVRHNFVAEYLWAPAWKPHNGLISQVLGGWQFSQTFFLRTGLPYSVTDTLLGASFSGTYSGTPLATFLGGASLSCGSPGPINNPEQCVNPAQFVPAGSETSFGNYRRNSFRGLGYFNSDFNAMKNFNLTEHTKLRVGANFFNVFNHPNFTVPIGDVANPAFGQIQNTVSPATSPYGSFQGAGVSGRLIQLEAHIQF